MLISLVDIPSTDSLDNKQSTAILNFITHIGILGPVLLNARGISNLSKEEDSLSMNLICSATRSTSCYITGQ